MILYNQNNTCLKCKEEIEEKVLNYSNDNFGHPLCRVCQEWLSDIKETTTATTESIDLFFALMKRNVPAILEKSDGYKTIDIAVPHAKVNIEVDGGHHIYNAKQAMSDLKRTLYSYEKGYSTLRIPNSLAKHDLDQAADLITKFLIVSRDSKKIAKPESKKTSITPFKVVEAKPKKKLEYKTDLNYSTIQNFYFPALADLIKNTYPSNYTVFDRDALKVDLYSKNIEFDWDGRMNIHFKNSNFFEEFKEKYQEKTSSKLSFFRVYWNRDVINLYFERKYSPGINNKDLKLICDNYLIALDLMLRSTSELSNTPRARR
jgi:hypothetical protein